MIELLPASPRSVGVSFMPQSTSVVYHLMLLIIAVILAMAFCGFAMAGTVELRSQLTQAFSA